MWKLFYRMLWLAFFPASDNNYFACVHTKPCEKLILYMKSGKEVVVQ